MQLDARAQVVVRNVTLRARDRGRNCLPHPCSTIRRGRRCALYIRSHDRATWTGAREVLEVNAHIRDEKPVLSWLPGKFRTSWTPEAQEGRGS